MKKVFLKRLTLSILIVFLTSHYAQAEVITLNSGKTIEGKILKSNDDSIEVDLGIGLPLTFFRDEIKAIEEDAQPIVVHSDGVVQRTAPPVAIERQTESQVPQATEAKSFLWEVKSQQTVLYLFGSIHLGKPSMYPLNERVENSFLESDKLVVEVDVEHQDPLKMQQLMMSKGMYLDGSRLERNISQRALIKLRKRLRKYKLRSADFSSFKPWVVATMLLQIQIHELGFNEQYGVDLYFINKASKAKKEILELESAEQQLNLLDGMPEQSKFLEYSLISIEETEEFLNETIDAWQSGNVAAMKKFLIDDALEEEPDIYPVIKMLLYDRNYKMAEKLEGYLNTDEVYFVVVGAGHLVGDEGIPELLKKAGFSVNQL